MKKKQQKLFVPISQSTKVMRDDNSKLIVYTWNLVINQTDECIDSCALYKVNNKCEVEHPTNFVKTYRITNNG